MIKTLATAALIAATNAISIKNMGKPVASNGVYTLEDATTDGM